MHPSVIDFLKAKLWPAEVTGHSVLEVGSQNVNGSPREVIEPMKPSTYIGVDSGHGRGVDMLVNAANLTATFGRKLFDVVISTEMLEHVKDWKPVVSELKRVMSEEGLLVVTTRSQGFPYHGYPDDHWRFSIDDFRRIFSDLDILALEKDPMHPGVFLKARKPAGFREQDLSQITVASAPPKP